MQEPGTHSRRLIGRRPCRARRPRGTELSPSVLVVAGPGPGEEPRRTGTGVRANAAPARQTLRIGRSVPAALVVRDRRRRRGAGYAALRGRPPGSRMHTGALMEEAPVHCRASRRAPDAGRAALLKTARKDRARASSASRPVDPEPQWEKSARPASSLVAIERPARCADCRPATAYPPGPASRSGLPACAGRPWTHRG
jgi:hypothetical protein